MKKQIFIFLLFSAILMQCQEELPVAKDFPIVITTRATSNQQGFTFEGKLINDGDFEILTHGFIYIGIYSGSGSEFLGRGFGTIVYELGNPGDKPYKLNTATIGKAPIYEYRAFVTYLENSTKKTFFGNVERIASKAEGNVSGWNLIAANESFRGSGDVMAVATYYREGTPEAYFIKQDGKVTMFDINARVTSPALDFPLNANQADLKLYGIRPFVLNNKNDNVYRLQKNSSWTIITQLPFEPEKLATGIYISEYYPHVYIFGNFGTHLYNFRDNIWETRTTLPLASGESIVAGTNVFDQHYILTSDGKIQRYNGSSPPILLTTFPHPINGQAFLFTHSDGVLYILNNSELWRFDYIQAEWSQAQSFPQTLDNPVYFRGDNEFYVANKNASDNYDIWRFGLSE